MPIDLKHNTQWMKKDLDPRKLIEKIFGQIKDAFQYIIFAGQPMQEHDLVQAAEFFILKTRQFSDKYKGWGALPDGTRACDHFQDFWQ